MLTPFDKESAFAAIAEDLELPLLLLSNPDTRVQLEMVRRIGAALLSTSLTFRDLAERVTAPRPREVRLSDGVPMPTGPRWPTSEIEVEQPAEARAPTRPIGAETVLSNDELRHLGGYRTAAVRDGTGDATDASSAPADPIQANVESQLSAYSYRTGPSEG